MHHISVTCRNIEKTINFYLDIGFIKRHNYEGNECRIVLLEVEGIFVELFQYKNIFTSGESKELETQGYTHIALSVDNIVETKQTFERKGYEPTEIKKARTGVFSYFFIRDPEGNLVEILEILDAVN